MAETGINVIKALVSAKLRLGGSILRHLPPEIRPAAEEFQVLLLSSLRNCIDSYLATEGQEKSKETGLHKIDLE